MQKRSMKGAGRVAACAAAAAIMFSSMHLELLAKEANGLPSAGIDFFLSADATSVKTKIHSTHRQMKVWMKMQRKWHFLQQQQLHHQQPPQ